MFIDLQSQTQTYISRRNIQETCARQGRCAGQYLIPKRLISFLQYFKRIYIFAVFCMLIVLCIPTYLIHFCSNVSKSIFFWEKWTFILLLTNVLIVLYSPATRWQAWTFSSKHFPELWLPGGVTWVQSLICNFFLYVTYKMGLLSLTFSNRRVHVSLHYSRGAWIWVTTIYLPITMKPYRWTY